MCICECDERRSCSCSCLCSCSRADCDDDDSDEVRARSLGLGRRRCAPRMHEADLGSVSAWAPVSSELSKAPVPGTCEWAVIRAPRSASGLLLEDEERRLPVGDGVGGADAPVVVVCEADGTSPGGGDQEGWEGVMETDGTIGHRSVWMYSSTRVSGSVATLSSTRAGAARREVIAVPAPTSGPAVACQPVPTEDFGLEFGLTSRLGPRFGPRSEGGSLSFAADSRPPSVSTKVEPRLAAAELVVCVVSAVACALREADACNLDFSLPSPALGRPRSVSSNVRRAAPCSCTTASSCSERVPAVPESKAGSAAAAEDAAPSV